MEWPLLLPSSARVTNGTVRKSLRRSEWQCVHKEPETCLYSLNSYQCALSNEGKAYIHGAKKICQSLHSLRPGGVTVGHSKVWVSKLNRSDLRAWVSDIRQARSGVPSTVRPGMDSEEDLTHDHKRVGGRPLRSMMYTT